MPNPLSRVHPNPTYDFYLGALPDRPKLAVWVAHCIGSWSRVEAAMGRFLVSIMGAQAKPTLAMFGALQSNAAKIATVTAAGEAILTGDNLEAMQAILPVTRRVAAQRHKFAHHIWGTCIELPNALLLLDPKDDIAWHIDWTKKLATAATDEELDATALEVPPADKAWVYTASDFKAYAQEALDTHLLWSTLGSVTHPAWAAMHDSIFPLLANQPLFQTALSQLRQRRSNQAARQQSPDEG